MKRYHIASSAEISLVENAQSNESCFWRLRYETASPKRDITLYLSPDGSYLLPTLYDLRIDPLAEEKAHADKLMKTLVASSSPTIGPATSAVTIVEFSDFECPYCKRMKETLENEVLPDEKGKVRLIFRNFPLPMHPWAKTAAQMAECVSLQKPEAFWKLHDYLFEHQTSLTIANIRDNITSFVASNVDIDKSQFQTCVEKDLAVGPVAQDIELGQKNGVVATHTIFINGVLYQGAKSAAQLRELIEAAGRGETPPSALVQTPAPQNAAQCAPRGINPGQ
jgi:protein-disulfide isomerase